MVVASITIPTMGKNRQDKGAGKPGRPAPPNRTPNVALYARVPVVLGAALEAYLESARPKTDKTAVIQLALEEYLAKHGFWPFNPPPAATN